MKLIEAQEFSRRMRQLIDGGDFKTDELYELRNKLTDYFQGNFCTVAVHEHYRNVIKEAIYAKLSVPEVQESSSTDGVSADTILRDVPEGNRD